MEGWKAVTNEKVKNMYLKSFIINEHLFLSFPKK